MESAWSASFPAAGKVKARQRQPQSAQFAFSLIGKSAGLSNYLAEALLGADGVDDHPVADARDQSEQVQPDAGGHSSGELAVVGDVGGVLWRLRSWNARSHHVNYNAQHFDGYRATRIDLFAVWVSRARAT